jgi:hypothetical protein
MWDDRNYAQAKPDKEGWLGSNMKVRGERTSNWDNITEGRWCMTAMKTYC